MNGWYRRLIPAIIAICLLLGTGTVAHAVSDEEAVLIPGAMPFKYINPFYLPNKLWLYPNIGINFRGEDDAQVIDYSQNPLASNWAIRQGVERATAAVRAIDGKVVVIGESMGSMVAARVAAELADSSHPPSVDDVRVILMAPPEAGAARYFRVGTYIPILNYRVSRIPESPYPTTIVIGEYDFWSDPPDRPWNLVSLLNAALGAALFVHGQTSLADPADVPPENITVAKNSRGALVTTYFVPTKNLPLTQLLRLVVPGPLVDVLDGVLRPVVDAGYHRHDAPGDPRPYLSDGRIHWPAQEQQAVTPTDAVAPEPVPTSVAVSTSDGQPTAVTRNGVDTSAVAAPPPSGVDATQLDGVEAAVQDGRKDAVHPAMGESEAVEPESESVESPVATEKSSLDPAHDETGSASITQQGAPPDNTATTGDSSPTPAAPGDSATARQGASLSA